MAQELGIKWYGFVVHLLPPLCTPMGGTGVTLAGLGLQGEQGVAGNVHTGIPLTG